MTEHETPDGALRIRIKALPESGEFEEFDLRRFRVGQTYDVAPQLASLLIVAGYAELMLLPADRAEAANRLRKH